MTTPDNTGDQEFYDSLVNAADIDESAMALPPGSSVIFPDGTSIHRHETGWNYGGEPADTPPDGPYDAADLTIVHETPEQAFRRLLGG